MCHLRPRLLVALLPALVRAVYESFDFGLERNVRNTITAKCVMEGEESYK